MSTDVSRRALLGGCGAVGLAGLAGCVSQALSEEEVVSEEHDAADIESVVVDTTNGDIDVRGEATDSVRIEATKEASSSSALDDLRLAVDRDGETFRVESDVDDDGLFSWFRPTPRLHLELVVPADLAAVTADTTNGEITGTDLGGDFSADTTNGDVTLESGDLGTATVDTTNGDVELDIREATDVTVDTTNGDVELVVGEATDVTVDTTNGDVEVVLPATAEPELVFDTTNGDLAVGEFDAGTVDADGSVRTTIGDGTQLVDVDTTNGDLDVRTR